MNVAFSLPRPRSLISLCAALFFLQAAVSARQKSLTWDEPTFIVSGLSYLQTGEIRINVEAPPLPQYLYALPLLFLDLKWPDYSAPDFAPERQVRFARSFIEANAGHVEIIATLSRFTSWIVGAALVWLVGAFATRLLGEHAGVTAAAVTALSPNLLAHSRLATSDVACTLGFFAAIYAFYVAVERSGARPWITCGFATALAVLTKFTALLLGPILFLLLLWEIQSRRFDVRRGWPYLLYAAGVFALTITVGYLGNPWQLVDSVSMIYWNATPDYQFYLFGSVYDEPVWYYHLAAALVKTPIPTIFLFITATWAATKNSAPRTLVYLLLPAVAILIVSLFDHANLGLRRILPAYPFLYVFIGFANPERLAAGCRNCRRIHHLLLAWVILVAALIFPHHLSFFNVFAGGPTRGPFLLEDSNVDWGQDLPALRDWQAENQPERPLSLMYFGTVSPSVYGVDYEPIPNEEVIRPRPGVYAVSAHNLVYIRKTSRMTNAEIDWLERYTPFGRVGYSIYLYRFPQ